MTFFFIKFNISVRLAAIAITRPWGPYRTTSVYEHCLITLPVLYGCETWSFTLREERRLRVFENRVFRRTFGPKRAR
jgi:hypothetical protein